MLIGVDFDNTLVCYDSAIQKLADEFLVPAYVNRVKSDIKSYFHNEGKHQQWTEFQGHLYGPGMIHARPFKNCVRVLARMNERGFNFSIISHRSRVPYAGPKYDLHEFAQEWIDKWLVDDVTFDGKIFFNLTLDKKILEIQNQKCHVFIDDLIDVFDHVYFPTSTKKILFVPDGRKIDQSPEVKLMRNWNELESLVAPAHS